MDWFSFFAGFCCGWFVVVAVMVFVLRRTHTNQQYYRQELLDEIKSKNSEISELNQFINSYIAKKKTTGGMQ